MARPACVFQKPDVLRAVLGCLPWDDLQMVLAYVVRQHRDAMASVGEEGEAEEEEEDGDASTEDDGEGSAGAQGEHSQGQQLAQAGSSREHQHRRRRHAGQQEEGGPESRRRKRHHQQGGEDAEQAGSGDELVLAEPPAPPPLFELHVPDVGALHALVADVWNRDDSVDDSPPPAQHGSKPRTGGQPPAVGASDLDDLLLLTGLQMEGGVPSAR